jgi:hypothetical protein
MQKIGRKALFLKNTNYKKTRALYLVPQFHLITLLDHIVKNKSSAFLKKNRKILSEHAFGGQKP